MIEGDKIVVKPDLKVGFIVDIRSQNAVSMRELKVMQRHLLLAVRLHNRGIQLAPYTKGPEVKNNG